jgi:hypothetical protein
MGGLNDWSDPWPLLPSLEVPDHKPVRTGLLDRRGEPIERPPNPMGFHVPGKRRG